MKNLSKLTAGSLSHIEMAQFVNRNLDDLETAEVSITNDANVQKLVTELQAEALTFDKSILQIQKNIETEVLILKDKVRDVSYTNIIRQHVVFELSEIPAEVQAFQSIKILLDKHKRLNTMSYEAQTRVSKHLISEFKGAFAAAVITLNLGTAITRFENAHNDFDATFSKRSTADAGTIVYNTKAVRAVVFEKYKLYANYILAMANTTDSAYYNGMLNIINNNRKYYADLLAKRKGTAPTASAEVSLN
jgi:hypothetical protein